MARQKPKIQWIEDTKKRQATLRKRRVTLLAKAKELATLCGVAVAVVVFGYGEAVPTTWPSEAETKEILERYVALPDVAKGNGSIEVFLHERIEQVTKKLEKLEHRSSNLNADRILNEIKLGSRHNLRDLIPEVAAQVRSSYMARKNIIESCLKSPIVSTAPPPADDAAIVPVPHEPPVYAVSPPAAAPVVAHEPAPFDPMELEAGPRHGSYAMEMVEAIMDDRSGRDIVPTAADVERVLNEHGLYEMFNPQWRSSTPASEPLQRVASRTPTCSSS